MARFEVWANCELTAMVVPQILGSIMFTEDSGAHQFGVRVTKNGEPVSLSGVVDGIIICADGYTARCTGTISENTAVIIPDADAYHAVGDTDILLRLTDGETKTVLAVWHTYVMPSDTIAEYDPSNPTPIETLLRQVEEKANQALAAATNAVENAANALSAANTAVQTAGTANTTAVSAQALANTASTAANNAIISANGKTKIYVQGTQPDSAIAGDGWFDTSNDNKFYIYSGNVWNATLFGTAALAGLNAALLTAGTLPVGRIEDNTISGDKIISRTIAADRIAAGAITAESAVIADSAIQNANIANLAVTNEKIVSLSADKITAGTIDARQINVTNLNAANLTVGAINGSQIAPGAIAIGNLGSDVTATLSDLQNGISSNLTLIGNLTSGLGTANNNAVAAMDAANGKNKVYYGSAIFAPTADEENTVYYSASSPDSTGLVENDIWFDISALPANQYIWDGADWVADSSQVEIKDDVFKINDIWFDTSDDNKPYYWDGAEWVEATFGDGAISYINAAKITTGYLAAGRIQAGTITADHIGSNAANLNLSSNNSVITNVQNNLNYAGSDSPGGSAKTVSTGTTTLTATSFEVAFNGDTAMHIDSSRAIFDVDTLTATGKIRGDVVNRTTAAITKTVSFDNLQAELDALPKYLAHTVTFNVTSGVTGTVDVVGFHGNGTDPNGGLHININQQCQGRIRILYCTCYVQIQGNGPSSYTLVNNSATTTILVYASPYVYIHNMAFQGSKSRTSLTAGASDGIGAERGAVVRIYNCVIDRMRWALYANHGGTIICDTCKGGLSSGTTTVDSVQNEIGMYVKNGGSMFAGSDTNTSGARPSGRVAASNICGYSNLGSSTITVSPLSGETPVTPTTSYTFTAAGSYRAIWNNASGSGGYVSGAGWSNTSPRKGYAGSSAKTETLTNPHYFGLWYFSSADLTAIGNISSASSITVTVTRDTSMGADSAVPVKLYWLNTAYTSSSGPTSSTNPANILTDTGIAAQSISRGGYATFTLTSSLITNLLNGTIKGFGISSASDTQLVQMTSTGCKIQITT